MAGKPKVLPNQDEHRVHFKRGHSDGPGYPELHIHLAYVCH
jgi:hypothetical protein